MMEIKKSITITDEMIRKFSELSGDYNPIHLDDSFAEKSIFKRRVAHGLLVSSFFSSIISQELVGEGSIYLSQTLNFKKPCFVNDRLTYNLQISEKKDKKYTILTRVFNDNNELILDGTALIIKK